MENIITGDITCQHLSIKYLQLQHTMIHGIIIILPNKRSDIVIGEDKVRILITVPKEMKKDLELLAEKETRNVSNLIVAVLKDYIKNNK